MAKDTLLTPRIVLGEYLPTPNNGVVADLYPGSVFPLLMDRSGALNDL